MFTDAVGFNNVANCNRHLQKIKGMTPTEFRQRSSDKFLDVTQQMAASR